MASVRERIMNGSDMRIFWNKTTVEDDGNITTEQIEIQSMNLRTVEVIGESTRFRNLPFRIDTNEAVWSYGQERS